MYPYAAPPCFLVGITFIYLFVLFFLLMHIHMCSLFVSDGRFCLISFSLVRSSVHVPRKILRWMKSKSMFAYLHSTFSILMANNSFGNNLMFVERYAVFSVNCLFSLFLTHNACDPSSLVKLRSNWMCSEALQILFFSTLCFYF